MTRKIVLATGNQGKVVEMQQQLEEFGFEVVPQSQYAFEEAVEDGLSFVENAIIKARHACKHTGLPAIADDSGLEVNALKGAPGIVSSRYAKNTEEGIGDDANNRKLLRELEKISNDTDGDMQADRTARFQCVIVYMEHELDPTPIICQGTWEGHIALASKGDFGFGYDPLFYVPEYQCHAAELSPEIKKQLSHRGKALTQLKQRLSLTQS